MKSIKHCWCPACKGSGTTIISIVLLWWSRTAEIIAQMFTSPKMNDVTELCGSYPRITWQWYDFDPSTSKIMTSLLPLGHNSICSSHQLGCHMHGPREPCVAFRPLVGNTGITCYNFVMKKWCTEGHSDCLTMLLLGDLLFKVKMAKKKFYTWCTKSIL